MHPYLHRHLTLHGDLGKGMVECTYVPVCMHVCVVGGKGALLFKSHSTGKLSVPHFQGQERLYSELTTSDEIIQASKNNPEE